MTVRWGFLGAGYVASRAMAPAVHAAGGAVLHAVASRDEARSRALEPIVVHAGYRELLDDANVDAVYISLTNAQHKQWVIAALEAGKHVLCEKPLALNAAEARAMFDVARRADRLLVEASWVRWHPRFRRMEHLAGSGALGAITAIDSTFTFTGEMTDNYRLAPELGGGALLDVGCYQAQAWVAFTDGAPDMEIDAVERTVGGTGVDLTTRATATISGNVRAAMLGSFALPATQSLVVAGSSFTMQTGQGESFTSWREPSSLIVGDHVETFEPVDAFVVMVQEVSARIGGGEGRVVSPRDSIRSAEILDAITAFSATS
jgi:xylose dehydrogenase (NAD/NADP)